MFNLRKLLKYTIIALLIALVLKYTTGLSMTEDHVVRVTVTLVLLIFLVEFFLFSRKEHMDNVLAREQSADDDEYRIPANYSTEYAEEDELVTGIKSDKTVPGYYLINNGNFTEGEIPYAKAQEMINKSMYKDLFRQHNFNIISSPHTHIGKSCGYLNWDKVYD